MRIAPITGLSKTPYLKRIPAVHSLMFHPFMLLVSHLLMRLLLVSHLFVLLVFHSFTMLVILLIHFFVLPIFLLFSFSVRLMTGLFSRILLMIFRMSLIQHISVRFIPTLFVRFRRVSWHFPSRVVFLFVKVRLIFRNFRTISIHSPSPQPAYSSAP